MPSKRNLRRSLAIAALLAPAGLAADAGHYDPTRNLFHIPNVVFQGDLLSEVTLRPNPDDSLTLTSSQVADDQSLHPDQFTYVFDERNFVRIPRVVVNDEVFSDIRLDIVDDTTLTIADFTNLTPLEDFPQLPILYRHHIEEPIIVSSNVDEIRYPDDYLKVSDTAVQLINAPCELYPNVITFPAEWMGEHDLPEIRSAPFDSGVGLGLRLKDNWMRDNPAYSRDCVGDERANFLVTIQRALDANAEFIEIIPWTSTDNSQEPWRVMHTSEQHWYTSTMPDEDIEWVTQTAQSYGLKVYWRNQILDDINNEVPEASMENLQHFIPAYEAFLLERAEFLNAAGVDGMEVGCTCWFPTWVDDEVGQLFNQTVNDLIPRIRERFDGELFMEYLKHSMSYENIRQQIDRFTFHFWEWMSDEEIREMNIDHFVDRYLHLINYELVALKEYDDFGDFSFHFGIGMSSQSLHWDLGYVEETFCTPIDGTMQPSTDYEDCLQRTIPTDFSLQARVLQAQLEAIKAQDQVKNYSVIADYWLTPNIMPGNSFPNIAYSVRNKPAEKILRTWFDRE